MQKPSDELGPELEPVLKSDYCPECHRVGCCRDQHDCIAYRLRVDAALDRGLELAFRRMSRAAAALIQRGECDA